MPRQNLQPDTRNPYRIKKINDNFTEVYTKLDTIEEGATADQTGPEIKALYEAEPDTNAYTDAEKAKLAGVEQTFSTAEKAKLAGIEDAATADQTDAEIETAYNNQVPAATQAEADAGLEAAIRRFSPLRIAQAIAALAPAPPDAIPDDDIHFTFDEANDLLKILDGSGNEWARFNLGAQDLVLGQSLSSYVWDADALGYFARAELKDPSAFDQIAINPIYTSTYIKVAINEYVLGLKAAGIWNKLVELHLMAGVTYAALLTKLKYATVADLSSFNFGPTDYIPVGTGAGLAGNGANKYLLINYDVEANLSSTGGGLAVYITQPTTVASSYVCGLRDASGNARMSNDPTFGPRTFWGAADSGNYGAGVDTGFFSISQTATTSNANHNGTNLSTSTGGGFSATGKDWPVFCGYNFNGYKSFGDDRLTLHALDMGLTPTEAISYAALTNTLMAALGCNVYAGSYTDPTTVRPASLGVNLANPSDTPAHTLEVNGSFGVVQTTLTASATLDGTHSTVLVDASAGAVTVTLPAAATCSGRIYTIKNIDNTNTVTVDADGSETIDGSLTQVVGYLNALKIQSDGSNWWII